jgi:hypothetical protein
VSKSMSKLALVFWLCGAALLAAAAFVLPLDEGNGIALICLGVILLTIAGLETFVWSRRGTKEKESDNDRETELDNDKPG